MEEPDRHAVWSSEKRSEKELVWRRGQTVMETEGEERKKGRDLRERMSETLVPEAWAEAFSCWCQNVFLRACGQTEIKGNRVAEWHHTHTHTHTHDSMASHSLVL